MRITAPAIDLDEEATENSIDLALESIGRIEEDPFVILSRDELTYTQTLHTPTGYLINFQEGSIDRHYQFEVMFDLQRARALFKEYLSGAPDWAESVPYHRVSIRGFWGELGYSLGSFVGNLVRGFKEGRSRNIT